MSVIKFIVIGLIILAVAYLAGLSFLSRQHRLKAEGERQLSPCSDKPNCVSSLATDEKHTILPLSLVDTDPDLGWNKLMAAIQQNKGEILINDGRYVHAVFTSRLFRFKDDLEARIEENRIDIRSASRVGTSDFGQNRKRVEQIRQLYSAG